MSKNDWNQKLKFLKSSDLACNASLYNQFNNKMNLGHINDYIACKKVLAEPSPLFAFQPTSLTLEKLN